MLCFSQRWVRIPLNSPHCLYYYRFVPHDRLSIAYFPALEGAVGGEAKGVLREEVRVVNKTELIAKVAEKTQMTKKDATQSVEAVLEAITEALKNGEKVQLIGFGNFEVRERAARKGRNPQTGKEITIPASKVPAFKPGKALKDEVNK